MKRTGLLLLLVLLLASCWSVRAEDSGLPDEAILYIPNLYQGWHLESAPIVTIDGLRVNDVSQLGNGVAWLEGTAWPADQLGRAVLAGHNPGAFEHLDQLVPGDVIYVFIDWRLYAYRVIGSQMVNPAETWILYAQIPGECSLVLLTCSGDRRLAVTALCTGGAS